MSEIKWRKVRSELRPFMIRLLNEDGIDFQVDESTDRIGTMLPSRMYHRYIERAMCLQQQGNSRIPVLSYAMWVYMPHGKGGCFIPLKKDVDKFLNL